MLLIVKSDKSLVSDIVKRKSTEKGIDSRNFKGILAVRIDFFLLKVANIQCFILIAVETFHNIIRK